jgi:23S rRNA pseudouridine1911/1915/1917 synthase
MSLTARVPDTLSGEALDHVVRALFELSWGKARAAIATGKVSIDGATEVVTTRYVRSGQTLVLNPAARRPRPDTDLAQGSVVFEDAHVLVVKKPSGISSVPYDERETGTLFDRVTAYLRKRSNRREPASLGVVHRIDKETTGLLVFTKTWLAKQSLSNQFRAHTVERRYEAIAQGKVITRTHTSQIVEDRGDGVRGSYRGPGNPNIGQHAVTHVSLVQALEGASLIHCKLETGRTHQIRIHLSESGHPLLGEHVYIRRYTGPELPAPRLMLHAAELGFEHPKSGALVRFTAPMPEDMCRMLDMLRLR